ncbi:hypothetical protein BKA60DRAFT_626392 [Fusarium oxysporum]|nr:hypothetical protein BKA60DRAFT_626392 [Fusarium oxysporum]
MPNLSPDMNLPHLAPTVVNIQHRIRPPKGRASLCFTAYYGQLPTELYTTIKELPGNQGILMESKRNKTLITARTSVSAQFTDIMQATHKGIAAILCVFDNIQDKILIQEYLELNLLQLGRLSETELASSISQVIDAYRYLAQECSTLQIEETRVSLNGTVKLVMDLGYSFPSTQWASQRAADYWYQEFAAFICPLKPEKLTFKGHLFYQAATSKRIPPSNHLWLLERSQGPRGLALAVKKAIGVMLAGNTENRSKRYGSV